MKSTAAVSLLLAPYVLADFPTVTITAAPAATQSALISAFSEWDHLTLGQNMTVGSIISNVYVASAANPTAANAILGVRSHINYMQGPTPLFNDLENPASVYSSISAQVPTTSPFPQALQVVSDIYAYLGSLASSEINGQTTIAPVPAGWVLTQETGAADVEPSTTASPTPSNTAAMTTSSATASATSGSQTEENSAPSSGGKSMWGLAALFGAVVLAL